MKRHLWLTLILFCLIGALGSSPAWSAPQMTPALPNSLIARLKTISEDFVVVQVWSAFCAPCGEEIQEFNSALRSANQGTKKLAALGVPVQSRKRENRAFLDHFKPAFAQWEPDAGFEKTALEHGALPWTLLFGKDRSLIREWTGKITSAELVNEVNRQKSQNVNEEK